MIIMVFKSPTTLSIMDNTGLWYTSAQLGFAGFFSREAGGGRKIELAAAANRKIDVYEVH